MDRRLSPSRGPLGAHDRVSRIGFRHLTDRSSNPDEREHLRYVLDSCRTLTRHWQSLSERLLAAEAPDSGEPGARASERE